MGRVSVGALTTPPGSRRSALLKVPGLDPDWELPTVVIRGAEPGPTFAITAGLHAAEYVPIEAVTQLSRTLRPAEMRGSVIAVLLVNTPGFYQRSIYTNPRDGRNLNRAFPGDPHGDPSERVTAFLVAEVISGSDAYLDAHCGDLIEALLPFVLWTRTGQPEVDPQSEAMARAFGLDYVMAIGPDSIQGTAMGAGSSIGVPSISAEIGQQGICDAGSVARYLNGLQGVLGHLGIVEQRSAPAPLPVQLKEFAWVMAEVTGTYHPTVKPGERVTAGQPVATIRDWFGETVAEPRASASGIVTFCVTCLPVKAGDPLLGIGVL
ncbi:MAG: succinylglutamate desuccinylase/aspartoacylase family protein [Candidatus Dormibacteria bacterium]